MIKEIALTPDVFLGDVLYLSSMPPKFVYSNYCDGKWRNYITKFVGNLSESEELELIRKLLERWYDEKRFVYRSASIADIQVPKTDVKWAQEAIQSSYHYPPLHSIVTSRDTYEQLRKTCSILHTTKIFIYKNGEEIAKNNNIKIERSVRSYVEKLKPLFKHSRYLKLIDYCMNPEKDHYNPSLKGILECFFNGSNKVGCELHLSLQGYKLKDFTKKESDSKRNVTFKILENYKYMKIFKEGFNTIIPRGKSIQVFVWKNFNENRKKLPKIERLHNRFILTDILGILIANGLDIDTGKAENKSNDKWTVFGQKDLGDEWYEYQENSTPYKLFKKLEIKG